MLQSVPFLDARIVLQVPAFPKSGARSASAEIGPGQVNSVSMSIPYRQASYLISAPRLELCPSDSEAEVAFIGRSNAGKSSAINSLTGQSKLARTSKTP